MKPFTNLMVFYADAFLKMHQHLCSAFVKAPIQNRTKAIHIAEMH